MIQSISQNQEISKLFVDTKLESNHINSKKILIKINLARPPKENHPRTDAILLKKVVEYFLEKNCFINIVESADGYLKENLRIIGLLDYFIDNEIKITEVDDESPLKISINNQAIFIPDIFRKFDCRISLPCASKRKDMLFSNNIKNFVGAIPRKYYLNPDCKERWRAKLHESLTDSVCNVYMAFEKVSKFDYYINGGNAYSESKGTFNLDSYYLSDNAIELDEYIYKKYFHDIEEPEYLKKIKEVK